MHKLYAYDFSYTYEGKTLYYNVTNSSQHTVSVVHPATDGYYYGYVSGNIIIPDSAENNGTKYAVTSISGHAFQSCTNMETIIIPSGITQIGESAFIVCIGLTSVVLPSSLISIGTYAFSGCYNLFNVFIPDGVNSIGRHAFDDVQNIIYHGTASGSPWGAAMINVVFDGDYVYADESKTILNTYRGSQDSVIIPSTVVTIADRAFYNCNRLKHVSVTNNVVTIGFQVFESCDSLNSIIIGSGVSSIGGESFKGCKSLSSIVINEENAIFDSRDNCNAIVNTTTNTIIVGCKNTTIPSSVTSIGVSAFEECVGLTSINIPDNITSIGGSAFAHCSQLSSVILPSSISEIGYQVFSWCGKITSITIPSSVNVIGRESFYQCSGLVHVTIPSTVTTIGLNAFDGCNKITSLTIPDAVATIGENAFNNVRHIEYHGTALGAPWGALSMNGITDGIFVYYDENMSKIKMYIGNYDTISIPSTVQIIGDSAFAGCMDLSSVTIPYGVDSICDDAFAYCYNLSSIIIPNTVSYIGHRAFYFSGLLSVILGEGVTYIGDSAFSQCFHLSMVNSRATIAPTLHNNNANNCVFQPGYPIVNIPCGSITSYSTKWTGFSTFEAFREGIDLTALSSDSIMGVVDVIGEPTCESPIASLQATANTGYHFTHWSDGTSLNPYVLTVICDTTIIAYFDIGCEPQWDTLYLHDTITIHDTSYVDVPYPVHDTTYVNVFVHDTTVVTDTVTLTEYVPVHDTAYIYVPVHDTTYIDVFVHDTTLVMDTVTLTLTQFDTITNTVFDTMTVTDTMWLTQTDTLWQHDTIIIHDTIYVTQEGIDGAEALNAKVYPSQGQIVIEGAGGNAVTLFDVNGRLLATKQDYGTEIRFDALASGTYMIKIGSYPARKVVVIR